jgi:hypothetical protein
MLRSKGFVKLVDNPQHTTYFWGPLTEIAGQTLQVEDFSTDAEPGQGDFLCLNQKGLVDVDRRDVASFTPANTGNPLMDMIHQILGGKQ